MKKKWPVLRSDEEAERINMHLPVDLLAAVKARARARGLPYQRFIREVLERAVRGEGAG